MNVSPIGIKNLFEFLGMMGNAIRNLLGQKVEVKGGVNVSLTIQLAPELENLIRDIVAARGSVEEPRMFFQHALLELIEGNEPKFRTLSQLNVTDVTLGTEAILQHVASVPDNMSDIFVRYVKLYILTPSPDEVSDRDALPVALTEALESAVNSTDENVQSLAERFNLPVVRPRFEPPE